MFPSPAAFGDPTHVNFISESTINYFVGNPPMASSLGYGFAGEFDITFSGWLRGAGPYDRKGSLRHEIEICPSSKKRTILRLKLLRRTLIALCNRNPQHALWVLKKVDI